MKKFLIAVLILIPAVVVLALSATGQIIKVAVKVEASDLIIKDYTDREFNLDDTYFLDLIRQNYLEIMVQVVPLISYNLNVIFRTTEDSIGKVAVESQEGTNFHKIYPVKEGKCDLLIIAANNEEVKKTIHLYITTNMMSDSESGIVVLSEKNKAKGGEVLHSGETYYLTGPARLFLDCYPAESIGNNEIAWNSKDKSIVSIDRNGFIYPEGLGVAKISAVVVDKAGAEHTFLLNIDTTYAIAKRTKLHLSGENFENAQDYIEKNILLQSNLQVQSQDGQYKVFSSSSELLETIIVEEVAPDDLGIAEEDYFNTIYIGVGGYQIKVKKLDSASAEEISGLSFISSNPDIAQVEGDGKLVPIKQGKATIFIYLDDTRIAHKDINVSARAITFRLNRDNQSNLVGIKQEYVWGYNWLAQDEDGKTILDRSYSVGLLHSRLEEGLVHYYNGLGYIPNSASYLTYNDEKAILNEISLLWTVDNPNYAYVEQNGNLTFYEQVCGGEVTVTATELIHGIKTRLKAEYTFKFVADKTAVNIEDAADFRGVAEGYALPAVLHTNVLFDPDNPLYSPYYINGNEGNEKKNLSIRNNIYGNGKVLKGKKTANHDFLIDIRLQAQYYNYTQDIVQQLSPLIIENLELNGWDSDNVPPDEISNETLLESLIIVRYYLWRDNEYFNYNENAYLQESEDLRNKRLALSPIQINYCYLHNAIKAMSCYGIANVEVLGSIFSNLIFSAIDLELKYSELSTLTLNRVVIRDNTPVGVISILNTDFEKNPYAKVPCKIIVKGFLDAYTWMPVDGYGMLGNIIPRDSLDSLPSFLDKDALYATLDIAIRDLMQAILQEHKLTLNYKGKEYAHLAVLSLGLWTDVSPNRIADETGQYRRVPFRFSEDFKIKVLGLSLPLSTIEGMLPSTTLTRQSVVLSYDIARGGNVLLPDQVCPSNVELYNRLKGNY